MDYARIWLVRIFDRQVSAECFEEMLDRPIQLLKERPKRPAGRRHGPAAIEGKGVSLPANIGKIASIVAQTAQARWH